ncbi:hypothetical protein CVT25_012500 [Psilocybe cyanescens]|uniref:Uncharacterized protein n=1 Tax=Psilocybe cyanescens TaxID=93625 RepID=A0A409X0Z3_PSICY|nr:hypothetical protein CVT25_012500 [Psilocybe cyanescens]
MGINCDKTPRYRVRPYILSRSCIAAVHFAQNWSAYFTCIYGGHLHRCLYANNPPLCPLCRKAYQPNKMKRLHVDRPENIDDHKEIDLLQRLAVSWETPAEQLEEVTTEVDVWLRDRADDACIALRKARAALEKNRELQESEASLQDVVRQMQERALLLDNTLMKERTFALIQSEGYKTMIEGLTKYIVALKLEIEGMQSLTHRYTHSRNPLPRPPEPISTDQVPTFEQAVSESGSGMRFIELPSSPRRYPEAAASPLRYPFEVGNRGHHRKGKSKTKDHKTYDDTKHRSSSSATQQQAALSPRHNPSSHYVLPHVSSQPAQHDRSPTSTRASGLQTNYENTVQPLDEYELVSVYLREYSSGFVNGQQVAAGKKPAPTVEYPGRSYTAHPAYAGSGSSRHPVQPISAYEPHETTYTQGAANIYQSQPESIVYGGTTERSSRPYQRRQETAPSIMSSSASSVPNDRSPSTSRSRSRTGGVSSVPSAQNQAPSNPAAASVYSTPPPDGPVRPSSHRESRESVGPTSPLIPPPPPPPQEQQQERQQERQQQTQQTRNRPPSIASARTYHTELTTDSWGTPPPSHLSTRSLIGGLLGFRDGAEPVLVGGQEAPEFRELGSNGSSVRTRESFSLSETAGDGLMQALPPQSMSPPRQVGSMVGVLPPEEDPEVSAYRRHSNSHSTRSQEASYRSPTAVDPRAQYGQGGWAQQGAGESGRGRNGGDFVSRSGYQTDGGDRGSQRQQRQQQQQQQYDQTASNGWHNAQQYTTRDDRSSSYRSPTSADHYRTSYDHRGETGYSRERSHTSSSSYSYSRNYTGSDERRQSHSHSHSHSHSQSHYYNDTRSIASSDRHSRSSVASRAPALPTRGHHLSLPEESPFPLTVEYTDDDDDDEEVLDRRSLPRDRQSQSASNRSRRGSGGPDSAPAAGAGADSESFGNALGLQLTTGTAPLSAPTPVASSHGFLRSWSREH